MADASQPVGIPTDRRPTTIEVRDEGGSGSYHPNVVLCVDTDTGHVFAPSMVRPDDDECVFRATLAAQQEIGREAPGSRIIWIARGLALFDSGQHFDDMKCDRGRDGAVYASFERRDRVPHTVVA